MPKATDYILQMQELIRNIIKNGFAYISEGSVYFDVNAWRDKDTYGKLKNIDFENFRAGTRIDSDQYEREQANDFALWKAKKPDEPFWDFEIDSNKLPGRPGWHIECSAMEKEILGIPFDIHTGGIDLKFPHHEDEIAQSKAGYGIEPTNYWCHNEFLEVEGEKMSKSLGNFFTLRDLMNKNIDPLDIRFSILSSHYGSTHNFTFEGIKASHKARIRIQEYIYSLFEENSKGDKNIDISNLKDAVYSELANDLHTPKALGNLFSFINNNLVESLNSNTKQELIKFFDKLNNVFSVWVIKTKEQKIEDIPNEIIQFAELRVKAKQEKNWTEADKLRNDILNAGFEIKDSKAGYVITKK